MNCVRTEKVYKKGTVNGITYYLHEVESGGQINRYLTDGYPTGPARMPGDLINRGRVRYKVTSDLDLVEVSRKPPLKELEGRIRKIAQGLVDKKVYASRVNCSECDAIGMIVLLRYDAKPLNLGCSASLKILSGFVYVDDDYRITNVHNVFTEENIDAVDQSYLDDLQRIEEWLG